MFSIFKKQQPVKVIEKTVYKDEPKTEEEKMLAFAELVGEIDETRIDPDKEDALFKELANVDHLADYLRNAIARDMQRYFAATNDEQRQMIKGAIARTAYMRSKIMKREDHDVVESKMKGLRYG